MTDDDLWRTIEGLAKGQEPAIRQAFLSAVKALKASVSIEDVAVALERGGLTGLLALFPDAAFKTAFQALPGALHGAATAAGAWQAGQVVNAAHVATARTWAPKTLSFAFDALNPKLIDTVRRQAADLVVEIGRQTREAIREEVRLGMERGENPRTTARAIREHIGLTSKQQQAVANFRYELERFHERESAAGWNLGGQISRAPGGAQTYAIGPDGLPLDQIHQRRLRDFRYDKVLDAAMQSGKPLTAAQIDKMTDAYSRKYLKYRSETIATTEALRASNLGIEATWKQAIDENIVQNQWLRKRWGLALGSDRTCLVCRPMPELNAGEDGLGIALDAPFMTAKGDRVSAPPLHPRCRCILIVKIVA
jgi:hypothetical protein